MIKALMFDLDDTLLWDKKSVKEALRAVCLEVEQAAGIPAESFENTVRKTAAALYQNYESYPFTKKIGINPFEGLWGTFPDKINVGFRTMHQEMPAYQEQTWIQALREHGVENKDLGKQLAVRFPYHRKKLPFIYPETFEVLSELKDDYQLLLLTNGAPSLQNTKLDMTPQLVPYFDYIVISGAFGFGKPDPSIFYHALKLLDIDASEAVMIGDNLFTDIDGANRSGVSSIWLNREGKEAAAEISFHQEISNLNELRNGLNSIVSS
ncbi:HAD family hydrolase [Salibacterium aidingense]|uniref:HAD family hydrolase n=1 Tax=Salibacterium aidingense TaxID=384933 RepID=UPI003BD733A3